MRIAIIGVGGLGAALARSMVQAGVDAHLLILVDRRVTELVDNKGQRLCIVQERLPTGLRLVSGDLIVIAVKPQDISAVAGDIRGVLSAGTLVLSVMAGVSLERLRTLLDHERVVRAMPNLGAQVGQSATVYHVPPELSATDQALVEEFLSSIGSSWRVDKESLLDVATAVAGSGPAYVCWLAEQMQSVACELGIPVPEAAAMVLQTLKATTSYLEDSNHSFADLRALVTSPGGTTAAALELLKERSADEIVGAAIKAAFVRSQQLGR